MRQKLLIFLALIFLIILLVGLNAASFVRKEKTPDTEFNPNRSTYNTGATGTRAFYDLLAETGRKPTRWQSPFSELSSNNKNAPSTFVIIGQMRRQLTDAEIQQLLQWVSTGGKLVIIDREPPEELIKTTANWSVSRIPVKPSPYNLDPSDQKQMTEKTVAAKPAQPTVFTANITAVQPSLLASSINFEHLSDENSAGKFELPPPKPADANQKSGNESERGIDSSEPQNGIATKKESVETVALTAPVVHIAGEEKNLLVDFPFGSGQIVFLSDPYIVSNGGINLVDNAQLGINIVASGSGVIAFDEYHQGFGTDSNRLFEYFSGTPVIAISLQLAAFIALILFAQSRRFARALPENEPNRLSKLEYVSAMAELQRRTRSFDLAIENIYTDFRRRASRSLGVDNYTVSLKDLAILISQRANVNTIEIENLMFKCEEIIRGEPTNKREVLHLTSRLRQLEEKLGLQRQRERRANN